MEPISLQQGSGFRKFGMGYVYIVEFDIFNYAPWPPICRFHVEYCPLANVDETPPILVSRRNFVHLDATTNICLVQIWLIFLIISGVEPSCD
jgi:hypothetical protein